MNQSKDFYLGRTVQSVEHRLIRRDGKIVWGQKHYVPALQ